RSPQDTLRLRYCLAGHAVGTGSPYAPWLVRSTAVLCLHHLGELEHSVPVATGPTRVEFLLHQRVRQLGTADAVRVDDVNLLAFGADDLAPLDSRLQRFHSLRG